MHSQLKVLNQVLIPPILNRSTPIFRPMPHHAAVRVVEMVLRMISSSGVSARKPV